MRVRNIPLPEPNLAALAVGACLHGMRPWRLLGTRSAHRLVGWPLLAAGTCLVARSRVATGATDLADPDRLVTCGPYARSRNPMYVGWVLLHLGAGAAAGSAWIIAGVPAAVWWTHRRVLQEERALAERFGETFGRYLASAPRYVGPRVRARGDRAPSGILRKNRGGAGSGSPCLT